MRWARPGVAGGPPAGASGAGPARGGRWPPCGGVRGGPGPGWSSSFYLSSPVSEGADDSKRPGGVASRASCFGLPCGILQVSRLLEPGRGVASDGTCCRLYHVGAAQGSGGGGGRLAARGGRGGPGGPARLVRSDGRGHPVWGLRHRHVPGGTLSRPGLSGVLLAAVPARVCAAPRCGASCPPWAVGPRHPDTPGSRVHIAVCGAGPAHGGLGAVVSVHPTGGPGLVASGGGHTWPGWLASPYARARPHPGGR